MNNLIFYLFLGLSFANLSLSEGRDGKRLSIFNVIRFANGPCPGVSNKNGTCYTAEECKSKGGTDLGTCAAGYGVCCTFTVRCGAESRENCTYFESTGSEVGPCSVKICKCDENVCQLRLDFSRFVISGPSTSTVSVGKLLAGKLLAGAAAGKEAATATQCLTDTFSVTNPSGITPPSICGNNIGEHMYVDASEMCNNLAFQLGTSNDVMKQWTIKVTQYSCDYSNLAPEGCTQYFFGGNAGVVKTFNFDGGVHLADQNQNICIRRERGICKVCWAPTALDDFEVSGKVSAPTSMEAGFNKASACCGYGMDGMTTIGFDCLTIPGAAKNTANNKGLPEQFCGRNLIDATADPFSGKKDTKKFVTVCCKCRDFFF